MTPPVASVVIPAHNEARVIEACLRSLLVDMQPGELEIVVACNGCTDNTEAIAASVSPEIIVVSTTTASKWVALNLGDETASAFPRMYVDADVIVSPRAIQDLADVMESSGAQAGAPRIRLSTKGQNWPVRAFYEAYQHSTYFTPPFLGLGFYAISEEGRARFDAFPDSGSDDLLIMETFGPSQRVVAEASWFEPALPKSFRELYRIRVRQLTSNRLREKAVAESGLNTATPTSSMRWALERLKNPRTAPATLLYLGMRPITEAHAWLNSRRGTFEWSRDRSSH